jgi:hypothetical protein
MVDRIGCHSCGTVALMVIGQFYDNLRLAAVKENTLSPLLIKKINDPL